MKKILKPFFKKRFFASLKKEEAKVELALFSKLNRSRAAAALWAAAAAFSLPFPKVIRRKEKTQK